MLKYIKEIPTEAKKDIWRVSVPMPRLSKTICTRIHSSSQRQAFWNMDVVQ